MWKKNTQTYWQATPFRAVAEPGIQLKLGMVSYKMSILKIFGHIHFKQKFHYKFCHFQEKISKVIDVG